jgi:hypothetical protein
MILAATRPTMIDVVVDELCISTVTRIPSIRPTMGFWRILELAKTDPADLPAKSLPAVAKTSSEQMKKYKHVRPNSTLKIT